MERIALVFGIIVLGVAFAEAQQAPVTAQVEILKRGAETESVASGETADRSNVVIWLSPLVRAAAAAESPSAQPVPQLVQHNKSFEPHVLVVQVGSEVRFPNKDPFFHNVFSLFDGKRFDLGLYEAGSSKSVRFDRAGVSFLFCNIHEQMSGVVIAVDTPYFGLSDRAGRVSIPNVPGGRYQMYVWFERSSVADLKNLDRVVTISDSARSLGKIRVLEKRNFTLAHKNKYGQDYVPPPTAGYSQP